MSSLNDNDNVPEPADVPEHGYWRSLAALAREADADDAGYDGQPHEFPASAADGEVADPLSRRGFVQVMGASLALAGVAGAGCKRWEKDEIVPLSRRPEDQIPGVPNQYATAWDFAGFGQALVATSYEGRPIKIDGNDMHPFASGGAVPGTKRHGGSTAFAQASILSLYDPDRSKGVARGAAGATFGDFRAWLAGERAQMMSSPTRIRILSEATSSPTLHRLRDQLRGDLGGAQWYEWEALSWDNERAGTRMAFGRPMRPVARLDQAQTIVALDCDLFVEHPAALRYGRDWARSRRFGTSSLGKGVMNRTYAIEPTFTSTGAVADHRLPLRAELILPFAMALDARLAGGSAPDAEFLAEDKIRRFVDALVAELQQHRGKAVVVTGRRQPPIVHALVARINQAIGAVGKTVEYLREPELDRHDHADAIARLVAEINQGQVDYLFILGGNPVFDAPADLGFAEALAKVGRGTVHLSEFQDETSKATAWHVPRAHYLEAWGDARTYDGTVTLAQPLIEPMYGGISAIELVQLVLGVEPDARREVEKTFAELSTGGTWRKAIHDGFIPRTAFPAEPVTVGPLPPPRLDPTQLAGTRLTGGAFEVVFAPSTATWDGRFANNAWLQETPDFLTKITWDNYVMVSPATAKDRDLGLKEGERVRISVGDRTIELPATIMPGQAPYSLGVVLGGGRTAAGRVGGDTALGGKKTLGWSVQAIRTTAGLDIVAGAKLAGTGKVYELANVQEHWDIQGGLMKDIAQKGIKKRLPQLVREATLTEANDPTWKAEDDHHFPLDALWTEKTYPEGKVHAWGMTIDLGSCVGCNACMLACQAENNVPVVGRKNVIRNREMHWIRIDRYFTGPPDDPRIAHQPLGCVHCENAPCEQVCPVGATIHTSEGLNDMIYNRCVGTRYCLNNCTYRVRRFNFFDYHKEFNDARNKVRKLLFNPEVTVRHRGVMEKCTYCVQRIQNSKIAAKNARVAIEDGDIVTACQAACPTEAIVFGDLNDPESRVRRLQTEDRRQYEMLGLFATRPRTHHLARIRNPNPQLEALEGNVHRGSH